MTSGDLALALVIALVVAAIMAALYRNGIGPGR